MIALAQRRLADLPWARVRAGDVGQLPYGDAAFDAAVCTQVYEYVADIEGALRELRRVLRPGGRALVMDTDWESCVWNSSDDARMRRVIETWNTHCPHPHLPRRLGRLLAAAGLEVTGIEIIPLLNTRYDPADLQRGCAGSDQGLHAQASRRRRSGCLGGGSARARVTRRILLQPEPLFVSGARVAPHSSLPLFRGRVRVGVKCVRERNRCSTPIPSFPLRWGRSVSLSLLCIMLRADESEIAVVAHRVLHTSLCKSRRFDKAFALLLLSGLRRTARIDNAFALTPRTKNNPVRTTQRGFSVAGNTGILSPTKNRIARALRPARL